jgi:TRAP-type C4-dicarboxylate transport system substrate-binding protein
MPYLFRDMEMVKDLIGSKDAPLFPLYQNINHENNVHCLAGAIGDLRQLINNKRLVKVPEDMKGLLVRVYNDNTVTTFWSGLCDTATLPIPEVYTALQLGTVDGMEFGIYSVLTNGFVDVIKYSTVINWQWSALPIFMISKGIFDSLDPVSQAILEDTAQECMDFFYTDQEEVKADAEKMLKERGVEVYHPTAEELAKWQAYGSSLYPQFRNKYGAGLFDKIIKICEEYMASH